MKKTFKDIKVGDFMFVGRLELQRGEVVQRLAIHPIIGVKETEESKKITFFAKADWFQEVKSGSFTIRKNQLDKDIRIFKAKKLCYGTNIVKVLNTLRSMDETNNLKSLKILIGWSIWRLFRYNNWEFQAHLIALFNKFSDRESLTKQMIGHKRITKSQFRDLRTNGGRKRSFILKNYSKISQVLSGIDAYEDGCAWYNQKIAKH